MTPVTGPDGHAAARGRILVVCTANITRSPMAALLLDAYLRRAVPAAVLPVVTSAGTHAREGDVADPPMAAIARRWGLDPDGHRSRPVSGRAVDGQDLVLTMEERHRSVVLRSGSWVAARTFTLTEFVGLLAAAPSPLPAGDGLGAVVEALHELRARTVVDAPDVADPHGGSDEEYLETAWELAGHVERIGPTLAAAVVAA